VKKEPVQYLRLKDGHPTAQKMQKLWQLADELGLHIEFYGHRTIVTDIDFPDRLYDMSDLENADDAVSDFPPGCEYTLRFENPEYTKYQEKLAEERDKQRKAEREAAEAAAAEKKRREEEERRRCQERQERAQLAELKAKYEGTTTG
jgi:hypothetical protein